MSASRLTTWARELASDRLLRRSTSLMSGTILTQAAVFFCSPLLSRLYGPGQFGTFANYSAWVSALALIVGLRYEHAIIVARDRDSIVRIFGLAGILSLAGVLVVALAMPLAALIPALANYAAQIRAIAPFIPFGILAACGNSALVQLNIKGGEFPRLARVTVAQAIATILVQLALGAARVENGLVIGSIAGPITGTVALGWLAAVEGRLRGLRGALRASTLRTTASEFRYFPRYALPADLLGSLAQQFTPVLIAIAFDPVAAGAYAFAIRIVRVPLLVVSTALNTILRKEGVDELERSGNLVHLVGSTIRTLAAIGIVPFLAALLVGGPVFAFVFGERWRAAGDLIQILSPGILLEFIAFPLSAVLLVTRNQRYSLVVQALSVVLTLAAIAWGRTHFALFRTTCALLSLALVITHATTILVVRRVARAGLGPDRADPGYGASLVVETSTKASP